MSSAHATSNAQSDSLPRRVFGLLGWSLLGLLVLAGAFIGALRNFRRAPFDLTAEALCRAEYQRSRSRTDSLMVDAHRPITNRRMATAAASCGEMRAAGRFQRGDAARQAERIPP